MANKKTTETKVEKVKDIDSETKQEQTEQIDYKSENDKLKNEMSELKAMLQQLLSVQTQGKQEIKNTNSVDGLFESSKTISEIPANKKINITSLFDGQLNLKGMHGNIPLPRFGVTIPVTYENLIYICNNQRVFAEEGYFFIHDKDVVESQYLTENYKKFVNKEMIENIITLPTHKIGEIYNNVTDHLKETIIDIVVKGVKSGDYKYSDRNKIAYLSEISDKDIYKMVDLLRDYDK